MALYDRLGRTYTSTRGEDPALARAIRAALGDARTVVNVGAGAGAYEPAGLDVTPVEPSETMIAQRPPGAAGPVVRAAAEDLPFPDDAFDAAMAILSDHHWSDRPRGLRELRRVARRRVVLFNADPAEADLFWLTREYLPGFKGLFPREYDAPGRWEAELAEHLGPVRLEPFPLPHDCRDGFWAAQWRRPEAYLDPAVRQGISVFHRLPPAETEAALARLGDDLATGAWHERHADLLDRAALHLGYYVVVAEDVS